MPSPWAMVDSSFPTFTGDEKPREQITALVDYMYMLTEALKYQLENLSTENWNTDSLESFRLDTTQDVTAQVASVAATLTVVVNEVSSLSSRVSSVESLSGRMNQVETDIAYIEKKQQEQQEQMEAQEETFAAMEVDIAELQELVRRNESGEIEIGTDGVNLRILGNVYINGMLME